MINYTGKDSFVWWTGVVEDIDDPEKLGRVRVRIFGVHEDDVTKVPTFRLPWAYPIMPVNSASISGIGTSPTGILVDSWVVGFFRDGEYAQEPVVWGTIAGKRGLMEWPVTSDLPQRATGENVSLTPVNISKSILDTCPLFSEPASPYAAEYPYNTVTETTSGHIIEYDDTPDAERIHHYHKSGTFEEYHPDGKKVTNVKNDNVEIVHGNKNVHIKGNLNIVVDGNYTMIVGGNEVVNVGGTIDTKSGGNTTMKAPKIDLNP
jgi:hypothetical protein